MSRRDFDGPISVEYSVVTIGFQRRRFMCADRVFWSKGEEPLKPVTERKGKERRECRPEEVKRAERQRKAVQPSGYRANHRAETSQPSF